MSKNQQRPLPKTVGGSQRWHQLDSRRKGMLRRYEGYASVTIPKICLPDYVNEFDSSIQGDWTSVGAQAVNHLTNKIAISLFRPGAPFFRLDPNDKLQKWMKENNVTDDALRTALVAGEQKALMILDQRAIRPKLNEIIRNLIVVGNVALDLTDDLSPRVIGIKEYAVKRSITGRLIEVLIREKVLWNELEADAQPFVPNKQAADNEDTYIEHIRWYKWSAGDKWDLSVWVDNTRLPASFDQSYNEDTFPVRVLTWDLADKFNYGTGLVEDMAGDFSALSTMTESEIKAAILASEFRWLADPSGIGDVNDVKNSSNGDVIPGKKDDLQIISLIGQTNVEFISQSADKVIKRIGTAFLLNSAVTRDAERVTAEEIRLQAQELETSLGGVYSRLAIDLQLPIAIWLLKQIKVSLKNANLTPTIVTGLAALSRNAEASQLQQFLGSVAQIATYPPEILARLQLTAVIGTLAAAQGIDPNKYVKPEAQVQQEQQQAQNAATQQQATVDASKAGAQALAAKATQDPGSNQ